MRTLSVVLFLLIAPAWAANPLLDGLVAYWPFEGSAANHPSATGGSAYNGTLMNGATLAGSPRVGSGALALDGTNDYLDVTTLVDVNHAWSVAAWYRPSSVPSGTTRYFVFENSISTGSASPVSFGLREGGTTANTNHQLFTKRAGVSAEASDYQLADISTANTWNHVLVVFTPATATQAGSVIAYLNGALTHSISLPAGSTMDNTSINGFHVGTYRAADGRWFPGSIDEVAIWNRSLTPLDVTELHLRGQNGLGITQDLAAAGKAFVGVQSANPTFGTVSGTGIYPLLSSVSIDSTALPGYTVTAWTGDFAGQSDSFTYTATSDARATATFGQDPSDADADGLSAYQEIVIHGTLPGDPDTDGDGIPDGTEVNVTFTSPVHDDSALVDFVRETLCASDGAAVALGPVELSVHPVTGVIGLRIPLLGSADGQTWATVPLSPGSAIIDNDNIILTVPAPSADVDVYQLLGTKP